MAASERSRARSSSGSPVGDGRGSACSCRARISPGRSRLEVVDALDLAVPGSSWPGSRAAVRDGDVDVERVWRARTAPTAKSENGAPAAGLVQRLGGGHLHRLLLRHELRLHVADEASPRTAATSTIGSAEAERRRNIVDVRAAARGARRRRRRRTIPPVQHGRDDRVREGESSVGLVSTAQMRSARRGRSPWLIM